MPLKLTKEQSLAMENKKLKEIIADLLHTLQQIAVKEPQVEIAKEAITKALESYISIKK